MTLEQRYTAATEYIRNLLSFGSKPGLERIAQLLERCGSPQKKLSAIHVAGTNGKGSTCRIIAGALTAAGYKTGLYISPAVEEFSERIQIDGEYISHEAVVKGVERFKPICEEMVRDGFDHPTEFEVITAMALEYFLESGCDAVVLETGLGGRFDATNVFESPKVSVITSVSSDHTAYLGDTVEKIAFEKAGIMKKGRPTVCYPVQPGGVKGVIADAAAERGSELVFPELSELEIVSCELSGSRFVYRGEEYFTPLAGEHFVLNAITAIEALGLLSREYDLTKEAVAAGVAARPFTARFEKLSDEPLVIIDGAHNPDAAAALCRNIDRMLGGRRLAVVMGMFKDKDYSLCIPSVAQRSELFIATKPDSPRALEAEQVALVAAPAAKGRVETEPSPERALERALCAVKKGEADALLCCGSFSFLGQIKRLMSR